MKTNIKKDLSVLTTISESTFDKLNSKVLWCISDVVEKSLYDNEDVSEIDLGIGTLLISTSNETIKYKFIPSAELEKTLVNTVTNERNDLVFNIEQSLATKVQNVFKDFF